MHHPEIKPQNLQVIWNVQFITVSVSAWMIPPVYHSLRRGSIKNTSSASAIGVQSVRPTWFEDFAVPKGPAPQTDQGQPQPLHGLKLVIKEEALPLKEQPEFPAPKCPTTNWHLGTESLRGMGTHPVRKQGRCDP